MQHFYDFFRNADSVRVASDYSKLQKVGEAQPYSRPYLDGQGSEYPLAPAKLAAMADSDGGSCGYPSLSRRLTASRAKLHEIKKICAKSKATLAIG